jgi:hypothetical protein
MWTSWLPDGQTARNSSSPGRESVRAGFEIIRQTGHIVMPDGRRTVTIPRHNPTNAFTMFAIVRDAGLTIDQFRQLL